MSGIFRNGPQLEVLTKITHIYYGKYKYTVSGKTLEYVVIPEIVCNYNHILPTKNGHSVHRQNPNVL